MYFQLLGPLEVSDQGRSIAVGSGKRRALLGVLLLHANEVVSAERLIDELWGERPPATSAKSVQNYVSQLRRELHGRSRDGELLVTRSSGYLLRVGRDDLDVHRFERALAEGERALAAGEARRASDTLGDALELWRGAPLSDFAYEPFAQQEIARLAELRVVALEERIEAELALGRNAQVVGDLEALVREHPLREHIRGLLMVALYRCGRQAEALESYREGARRLREDLGLEPGPALRELEGRVLAHSPDLAAPTAPRSEPSGSLDDAGGAAPVAEGLRDAAGGPPVAERPTAVPGVLAKPAPAPGGRARLRRAGPLIVAASVLLAAAVLAAFLRSAEKPSVPPAARLDLAANSIAGMRVSGRAPEFGVPLPGRPTDVAAADGTAYVVTVESAALTVIDARSRSRSRTVPLRMTPGAVAIGDDGVWVADSRRGLVVRLAPGYGEQTARIAYRRTTVARPNVGGFRLDPTSLAAGAGAVWLTDGSARLRRLDPRTSRTTSIAAPRPLDGVAVGAGAVWAFSARPAAVVRVDPRTNAVTDVIPIVSRRGADAPFPIGIAANSLGVWVLNGNTATVTRIDPQQRGPTDTIAIGVDRLPSDIAAAGPTVWVANFDGSLSRIDAGRREAASLWVGESVSDVASDGTRLWLTTAALDQQLPGGSG
jgi:DNA-binding SARP family transcriptional activator